MTATKQNEQLWGELEHKFTPLISFYCIIDRDMALVKNILINYRAEEIFDLKQDKNYFQILGEVYRRKVENPLYCLLKNKDNEEDISFINECYQEFITDKESEVLSYGVKTDMYNLLSDFHNTSEIIPTILYYTQAQKDIIDSDPLLSKIKSIHIDELNSPKKRNSYEQFYFRTVEEAEAFLTLEHKTFYFTSIGINLNEANDDIKLGNEEVVEIYKRDSKINLFDIYRMDIIGGYSNDQH